LALLERTRSGRANSGVIYHTASHRQHNGDTNDEHEAEGVDEDEADEREFWLLRLESASLRAVDAIAHLQKEAGVLRAANAMSDEQRYAVREATATAQGEVLEQLRAAVGALKTNGGPAGGLWNTSDMGLSMSSAMVASGAQVMERLRAQVFAPSHALPSTTVEEFGQQEMRQMMLREREAKERQGRAREGKAVAGKDAVEEAEVLKARERDDWKDDNPRGWGNSALRNTR
jgi:immunoglobulin-binding protein 1